MIWTPHLDNLLRRHYPKGNIGALAERIGVTAEAVKTTDFTFFIHELHEFLRAI